MNGWERLGVIFAVVFGVPAFLLAYETNESSIAFVSTVEKIGAVDSQAKWNTIYLAANAQNPDAFKNCQWNTLKIRHYGDGYHYKVECRNYKISAVKLSLVWAFIPGIVLFLIGGLVAWVRAGFKG